METENINDKVNNYDQKSFNIDKSPRDHRYDDLRNFVAQTYPNPPPPGFSHPPTPSIIHMHNDNIQEHLSKVEEFYEPHEICEILVTETRFSTIVEYDEFEDVKVIDESNLSTPECEENVKFHSLNREETEDLVQNYGKNNREISKDNEVKFFSVQEIVDQNLNKVCEANEDLSSKKEEDNEQLQKDEINKNELDKQLKTISDESQKQIEKDFQTVEDQSWNEIDKNLEKLDEIVASMPTVQEDVVEKHSQINNSNAQSQGIENQTKNVIIYKEDTKESEVTTLNVTEIDKKIDNNIENDIENINSIIKLPAPEIEDSSKSPVILMQPTSSYHQQQLHCIEEEIEPGSIYSTFKGGELEDFDLGERKRKYCCNVFCF